MRFLIVKTSAFGDVVQAFCVCSYLKKLHPHCKIDWVVEKKIAPIVRAHPLVDTVIEVNSKCWKKSTLRLATYKELIQFVRVLRNKCYDAVFDLQGNLKSGVIDFLTRTDDRVGFGWKTASERANCCFTNQRSNPPRGQNIRRDYLFVVQNYFKDFTQAPCEVIDFFLTPDEMKHVDELSSLLPGSAWMICPGSAWKNKRLPEDKLLLFLEKAKSTFNPRFFFIWGTAEEQEVAQKLSSHFPDSLVAPMLTLPELQQMMKRMDLIISMDSFPLHLAGTTNTATFSFFGPSVSFKYRPIGDNHFSYQGPCAFGLSFDKRCSRLRTCKEAPCLKAQEVSQLFQSFSQWWGVKSKSKLI